MPRPIKNLTNMEIDEISLVDKGANQHAMITIAKRAPEEEEMPEIDLYNEDGELLDQESLENGDIVYDEAGAAYEYTVDDEAVEEEREPAEVGKAFSLRGPAKAFAEGYKAPGGKHALPDSAQVRGLKTRGSHRLGQSVGRNKAGYAAGGAGLAAGGASYAGFSTRIKREKNNVGKSFSDQVMEELSKAFTDDDRDKVLSKAFSHIEELEQAQHEAVEIAKSERDLRLTREYISKASDYNLPVDPNELGPVLYRMAESMSHEDCSVIAKCLETAGTILFEEAGFRGGGENADVMSMVEGYASEQIGKSAGPTDIASVFESNPQAYEEYLSAQRTR